MSIFNIGNSSDCHYIFFAAIISIKDQYNLQKDLEDTLNVEIVVERENGCAIFKTNNNNQYKCISYCQVHMDELIKKYNIIIKDLE